MPPVEPRRTRIQSRYTAGGHERRSNPERGSELVIEKDLPAFVVDRGRLGSDAVKRTLDGEDRSGMIRGEGKGISAASHPNYPLR